ncbi:MAG TPA: PilZ domain-containing protein [Acidimicrobiales bacterium]|nr:PilZ domain-containing protein [Acidimicrobiales bacterium]
MSAQPDEMELREGMRVGLDVPERGACVAEVVRAADQRLRLKLLDPLPDGGVDQGDDLMVFVARAQGIWQWPARLATSPGEEIELTLIGSGALLQRRTHPRVKVELACECRLVRNGRRGNNHDAVIEDLSRGGMRLRVGGPFQPGDRVDVTVDLDGSRVTVGGRAVMSRPVSAREKVVNLAFGEAVSGVIAAIDQYLAQRLGTRAS